MLLLLKAKYSPPLIIVDFGTATTICAVSEDGSYLGGAIAPGIEVSTEALFNKADKLPKIEVGKPLKAIGKNTEDSLKSGIYFGFIGQVEALILEFKKRAWREVTGYRNRWFCKRDRI